MVGPDSPDIIQSEYVKSAIKWFTVANAHRPFIHLSLTCQTFPVITAQSKAFSLQKRTNVLFCWIKVGFRFVDLNSFSVLGFVKCFQQSSSFYTFRDYINWSTTLRSRLQSIGKKEQIPRFPTKIGFLWACVPSTMAIMVKQIALIQ